MALLEVKNLTKNFGGLTAVGDVSMNSMKVSWLGLSDQTVLVKQPCSTF